MQGTQPDTDVDPQRPPSPAPPQAPAEAVAGPRLDRFALLGRVGAGGMGEVFSAYDPELDRRVAIKLVRPSGWGRGGARGRARALAEARAMARVSHPNVVTVYEVGAVDDGLYVAMEFVRGSTVRAWSEPPRPWQEVAEVFAQIARGLDAVHGAGLVHRDVKPDNLMVRDDGRAQVLDFGIARALEDAELDPPGAALDRVETDERGIVGTPAYLAPEIFAGFPADARSDQWALCVALYEVLYGRRPFVGNTIVELAAAIADADLPAAPKDREVPRRLHAVVARGLSPLPGQRWPSLAAIATALDDTRGARRRARGWLLGGAAVLGALALTRTLAPQAPQCDDTRAAMDAVWNPERGDRLRAGFTTAIPSVGADAWDHTAAVIDAYARSWIEARHDTCESGTVKRLQSERVMDLRLACLERRHQGFAALLDALEQPTPSDVENAIAAVASLASLDGCNADAVGHADAAPPFEQAGEIEDIRLALASLSAEYLLGRLDALPERIAALQDRAEHTGYPLLLAEIAETRGRIAAETGDLPGAARAFEDAYIQARRAGDPRMAAITAIALGESLGDVEEGARWLRVAELELPEPRPFTVELMLHNARGSVHFAQGEYLDAVEEYDQALAELDAAPRPPADIHRTSFESNRAVALTQLGRVDEALVSIRSALASDESSYGANHPALSTELGVLAAALESTGDFAAAAQVSRRAVAVREGAFGPDAASLGAPLVRLASALEPIDPIESRTTCERAIALLERVDPHHRGVIGCRNLIALTWMTAEQDALAEQELVRLLPLIAATSGSRHPDYAAVLNNLAYVEGRLGKLEAAEAYAQEAVDILRSTEGAEPAGLGAALSKLGRFQLQRGDAKASIATLEDAIAHLGDQPAPALVAETDFALAQALVATHGDRARANELAVRARDHFARAQPVDPARLAQVDAWLAERR